jgi:transcriptional regulator with XRE-family HTH domain
MLLKVALKIARITQQELATRARVPASTINRLANGRRKIDSVAYASVVRMARTLSPGMSVEELFPIEDAAGVRDRRSA